MPRGKPTANGRPLVASLAYLQVQAHCLVMDGDQVVGRAVMKPIDWFPGRGEDLMSYLDGAIDALSQDDLRAAAGRPGGEG